MRDICFTHLCHYLCLLGVAYNYFIPVGPLWLVISLPLFASINLRIVMLIFENRGIKFSEEGGALICF